MAEVLIGPTIGPKGDRVEGGAEPPRGWPKWFLDDLRAAGHLKQVQAVDRSPNVAPARAAKVTGTSSRKRSGA